MKPTLIIVDDVKVVRDQLHTVLQGDFDIQDEASCGKSAVEAVVRHEPNLVLMDVVMPNLSGLEATEIFMKSMKTPPKVVFLSGVSTEKCIFKAFEVGASDYLFKPIDAEFLNRVLWRVYRDGIN